MIWIQKGKEPTILQEYRCKPGANFDGFQNPGKDIVRESLLHEQGYICAYCMKSIHNDTSTKIEHYHKRNQDNQLTYTNLLVVCDGTQKHLGKLRRRDLTCDSFKGNLPLAVNPCIKHHIDTIYYNFHSGEILSRDLVYNKDLNDVLNLNNPRLMDNRKAALKEIKTKLVRVSQQDQTKFKTTIEKLYKTYSKLDVKNPSYVGIILAYLERKLKVLK